MLGDHRPPSDTAAPLADQAVAWLLLLRSGRATDAERAAFQSWRDTDPRHDRAWQQLTAALSQTLGRLTDLSPNPVTSPARSSLHTQANRRRFLTKTVGLAACTGAGLLATNVRYPLENLWTDFSSATGERKHITLADGSDALLDARTRLNFDFSETRRDIYLLAGALSLKVASDSQRPLRIHTAQGNIRSLGTQFMVRQEVGRSLVVVQEHEIEVTCLTGEVARLVAGTGARFDQQHIDAPRTDVVQEAAWQTGIIHVEARPLMQVIAALRPYYTGTLRISAAAGGLSVTGRFALDHVKGTLAALQQQLPITVSYVTPWITLVDMA